LRHGLVERLVLVLVFVGHGYAYRQRTGRLGCDTSEQGLGYRYYRHHQYHRHLSHLSHLSHRQYRGYLPTNQQALLQGQCLRLLCCNRNLFLR
jgi:hypothetical protein